MKERKYYSAGKQAYKSRIIFGNLIHSSAVERENKFYEAGSNIDIGRNLNGFFRIK